MNIRWIYRTLLLSFLVSIPLHMSHAQTSCSEPNKFRFVKTILPSDPGSYLEKFRYTLERCVNGEWNRSFYPFEDAPYFAKIKNTPSLYADYEAFFGIGIEMADLILQNNKFENIPSGIVSAVFYTQDFNISFQNQYIEEFVNVLNAP